MCLSVIIDFKIRLDYPYDFIISIKLHFNFYGNFPDLNILYLIVHNFKVKLFVIYVKCLWTSKD